MIIRELPQPNLISDASQANLQNEVICASTKGKYQYPNHTTPYLLVANFNNTGNYRVYSRPVSVNDKIFYFLNAGDELEINFKNRVPLQTLLILFGDEFIQSWINFKHTGINRLLADGAAMATGHWNIPNIPFEYNSNIINQLNSVKACDKREAMDDLLFGLLENFWAIKEGSVNNLDHIYAKRKSTKEELYRRLLTAKIFIHDNFNGSPTIEDIASEACLDKFHFLKSFKSLYGITPHQYLVKLKLDHAHGLLATGRFTVMQACNHAGFESQGTFTNLFKKHYRLLPSELSKAPKIQPLISNLF